MLPEAELARRLEHAADLGEHGGGIRDGAQNAHRDDGVEASVSCWECLGCSVDHVDRDGAGTSALGGDRPRCRVGFDRDDLRHARRVVLERAAVAAPDLEDASLQAGQEAAPQLARDRVGPLALPLLEVVGKARLVRAVKAGAHPLILSADAYSSG